MVYWMLRTGWHPKLIADRLGCSRRQIHRIRKEEGWSGTCEFKSQADLLGEYDLWQFYRDLGESYQKVGLRFGVSRQMVHKKLKQKLTNK